MKLCRALLLPSIVVICAISGKAAPSIVITNLPAYGTTNALSGLVLNVNPADYAIAVFIYVPGYGWVSKPTCAQLLTTIRTNGTWATDITTGSGDVTATRIAAVLVSTNYSLPCVLGDEFLSTNVFAQAVASAVVTRPQPGVPFLTFSGYDWWVKTTAGQVGPGPNYFSDSTNNVWTDINGWLHLRITHRSNQWQCAEIVSARTFGYGNYRLELNTDVDSLDANVTFGLFTWSDDPVYADREIDVECARWNSASDTNNSQFVVQPYDAVGHLVRYRTPASQTNSTHLFIWQTNRVDFQALCGSHSANPASSNVISTWAFTNGSAVPHTGDENMRINLWLFQGNPPTDNQEIEVIIKSFQFAPLGAPNSATLKCPGLTVLGYPQFILFGEPDRRYQIQTSSNLTDWFDLATMLATNETIVFSDTNSCTLDGRFYRAATLP